MSPITTPKDKWPAFWKRARQFHRSMQSIPKEDTGPVVSNAVICGISAIDSLAVLTLGKHSSNHNDSAMILNNIRTNDDNKRKKIAEKFMELVSLKYRAQYDDYLPSKNDAEKALSLAKEIFSFVESELRSMGVEAPQD